METGPYSVIAPLREVALFLCRDITSVSRWSEQRQIGTNGAGLED
jgi:hypothetical protein